MLPNATSSPLPLAGSTRLDHTFLRPSGVALYGRRGADARTNYSSRRSGTTPDCVCWPLSEVTHREVDSVHRINTKRKNPAQKMSAAVVRIFSHWFQHCF